MLLLTVLPVVNKKCKRRGQTQDYECLHESLLQLGWQRCVTARHGVVKIIVKVRVLLKEVIFS